MQLIEGRKDELDRRKERRKATLRRIMVYGKDSQKAIHAAVRWYGMREKWETDSNMEFFLFTAVLRIMAKKSPEWVATEFPAEKNYDGNKWGVKDYYSSIEALTGTKPFDGNEDALLAFLMEWDNMDIIRFCVAFMLIMDELREQQGKKPVLIEFMESHGVHPQYMQEDGTVYDHEGNLVGKVEKKRHLHLVC